METLRIEVIKKVLMLDTITSLKNVRDNVIEQISKELDKEDQDQAEALGRTPGHPPLTSPPTRSPSTSALACLTTRSSRGRAEPQGRKSESAKTRSSLPLTTALDEKGVVLESGYS